MKRTVFLLGAASLAGCSTINNTLNESPIHGALLSAERLNEAIIGTRGMARTYSDRDVDRDFRVNGLAAPGDAGYAQFTRNGFATYKLVVDGRVDHPQSFSLAQLRALQSLTQITRHDCVEGWSAIGKWSGIPLASMLALVRPTDKARYVVFHCMDSDNTGSPYYESLDLHQATHPQTLLALDLNDHPLDPDHGAPVRLRVPTQLGYKSAKWISRLELRDSLAGMHGGNGGYWEDQGYEWYAGI